jgi:hypothetical protein
LDRPSAPTAYFGAKGFRLQQMASRPRSPVALGALIGKIVEPVAARKGMGVTSLLTQWPEIVGWRLAKICRPVELKWPAVGARRAEAAAPAQSTLILRVDGAFVLETQHAALLIVDRINAHLGWACVAKVAFRQGPLDDPKAERQRKPAPGARANAVAAGHTAQIEETDLREALTRLGARVIDKAGQSS